MLIESLSGSVESVLDIGTGTGVLAIAASRLGAGSVTCIDIDPAAVELAQRNVKANSLSNITILEGGISTVSNRFHFIIANLISGVLIEIANELVMRLHSNGTAILSGMIIGQEEGVTEAMQREGLVLSEKFIDDKWVTLVFRTANV